MTIHQMEQQTPEWFAIKKGKMSASHADAIGNNGKGLETYILTLMSEYYSNGEKENYTNKDMDRGNELEDQARSIYAFNTGNEVEKIGFIEQDEFIGISPDGLVNDDGLVEIKCPNDLNYFKFLLNGEKEIDSKYIWQMQMQMLVSGRKWCDFVAYNPNFESSIFIHRVCINEEKQEKLRSGFLIGIEKIKQIKNLLSK